MNNIDWKRQDEELAIPSIQSEKDEGRPSEDSRIYLTDRKQIVEEDQCITTVQSGDELSINQEKYSEPKTDKLLTSGDKSSL